MKHLIYLFLLFSVSIFSQTEIHYEVSFPNFVHHEAEVKVNFKNFDKDTLKIKMSRTSPGRYALHEFSKNIYNVHVKNGNGEELKISSPNLHQWNIIPNGNEIIFSYTLFGDRVDGTYDAIDRNHAHLNIPASFVWAEGLDSVPIEISFKIPEGSNWAAATQLKSTDNPLTFTAPNYYFFLDSPVELSDHFLKSFSINSRGKNYKISLALHHTGTEKEAEIYTKAAEAIVNEEIEVWGELPDYDFGEYVFIADYLPSNKGDGMEHRNSTVITSSLSLNQSIIPLASTLAHEFFHCWNVERLRPKSLEPFDFNEANVSEELWFAEGFTSYYDRLFLKRAELMGIDLFAKDLSNNLNEVINAPGREFYGASGMSRQAPFVDAATSIDQQNKENTFLSYYSFGAAIGLGLDLILRSDYRLTLDGFMKSAWEKFGRSEIPYTNEDLKKLLADYTKSEIFADEFFNDYVYGKNLADYESLLKNGGFILKKKSPGKASAGSLKFESEDNLKIKNNPWIETPLYSAGISMGDIILSVDEKELKNSEDFYDILAGKEPGDEISITFEQRGDTVTSSLKLIEDQTLEVVPFEHESLEVTADIISFRENWLGKKSEKTIAGLQKHCPECKREYPFDNEYCKYDGNELQISSSKK